MKKQILTLIAIFIAGLTFAQTGGFNYKALIVDNGTALNTQTVTLKFTVLENGATAVYQETQTATTDANGIVSVNIGEGTVVSGTFSTIDWGTNPYFLKVEIDTGSGYTDFGTSEFKTVPYAKYADKAGNTFSGNFSDLNGVPTGLADGDDVNDADHSTTNELQSLNLSSNQLSITNGNSVTFSGWDTNASDDFSGNYNDLSNTPVLFNLATSNAPATSITQSVYHTGNMAIGTDATDASVSNRFSVKSNTSKILFGPVVQNSAAIDVSSDLQDHNAVDIKQNNGYTLSSKSAIHAEYLTDKVVSDMAYYRYENGGADIGYYGIYNQINPGGVLSYGMRNFFNLTANKSATGVLNEFSGTNDEFVYGTLNNISVGGNGKRIGNLNYIIAASTDNIAGGANFISNTSSGKIYGNFNKINGSGTGNKYGVYNEIDGSGSKFSIYNKMTEGGVGVNNLITGAGTAISNELTGTDGIVVTGVNTVITNSGNGIFVGESTWIDSAGTGDKYGLYSKITTSSGGKHYAVYGEAEKTGNDVYAGYFKGDAKITETLKIGTADSNAIFGVKADPATELVRFSITNTSNTNDVLDLEMEEPSSGTAQFIECNTNNVANVFTVDHNGDINTKGELHGKDTGKSDMKAYIYGSVDRDGDVVPTASSGGFTVTHTDSSTNGTYRINFTHAPGNTNYIVIATFKDDDYGFIYTKKYNNYFFIKTRLTSGTYHEKAFEFVVYKK